MPAIFGDESRVERRVGKRSRGCRAVSLTSQGVVTRPALGDSWARGELLGRERRKAPLANEDMLVTRHELRRAIAAASRERLRRGPTQGNGCSCTRWAPLLVCSSRRTASLSGGNRSAARTSAGQILRCTNVTFPFTRRVLATSGDTTSFKRCWRARAAFERLPPHRLAVNAHNT